MGAHSKRRCSACGVVEASERPTTIRGKIAVCDACIAELVDARNAERLKIFSRAEWMTRGREHLVLRRSAGLDGRMVDSFLCDRLGWLVPKWLHVNGPAATVGELLDYYTWLRDQERIGAFDAASLISNHNPISEELLAVFRRLPLIEWTAGGTAPLRFENGELICASWRDGHWIKEVLQKELHRSVRIIRGLPSAINERIDLLQLYAQGQQSRAA